jgi:hypothetical protein
MKGATAMTNTLYYGDNIDVLDTWTWDVTG